MFAGRIGRNSFKNEHSQRRIGCAHRSKAYASCTRILLTARRETAEKNVSPRKFPYRLCAFRQESRPRWSWVVFTPQSSRSRNVFREKNSSTTRRQRKSASHLSISSLNTFFSTFMSLNPRVIFLFAFLLSGLSIRTFRQIYRNIETSYSHGRSSSNVAAAGGTQ